MFACFYLLAGVGASYFWRKRTSMQSLNPGLATMAFYFLILAAARSFFGLHHTHDGVDWLMMVFLLPISWGTGLLLNYLFARLMTAARSTLSTRIRNPRPATETTSRDKTLIMQMLREEKVTPSEAQALLEALNESNPQADAVPLDLSSVIAVAGAVLVSIGFVLPWSFIHINDMMGMPALRGHQAGCHLILGWTVLSLGILPANGRQYMFGNNYAHFWNGSTLSGFFPIFPL